MSRMGEVVPASATSLWLLPDGSFSQEDLSYIAKLPRHKDEGVFCCSGQEGPSWLPLAPQKSGKRRICVLYFILSRRFGPSLPLAWPIPTSGLQTAPRYSQQSIQAGLPYTRR